MKKFIMSVCIGLCIITGSLFGKLYREPTLTPEQELREFTRDVSSFKRCLEELETVSFSARTMKSLRMKKNNLIKTGYGLSHVLTDEIKSGLALLLVKDVRELYSNFSKTKLGFVYTGQHGLPAVVN